MPYKFNVFTGTLDLVTAPDEGDITGPPSSHDKAIVRWSGTTGTVINDSPNTYVQDSGAVEVQAIMENRQIADTVDVPTNYTWLADSLEMQPGGVITMNPGSKIIIVN